MSKPNSEDYKLADAIGAQCVIGPEHGFRGGYRRDLAAKFIAMYREELTAKPAPAPAIKKVVETPSITVCLICGVRLMRRRLPVLRCHRQLDDAAASFLTRHEPDTPDRGKMP